MTRGRYTPSGRRRKSRTLRVFKSRRFQKSFSRNAKKKAFKKRHYKSTHLTAVRFSPKWANIAKVKFYDSRLSNVVIGCLDVGDNIQATNSPIFNLNAGINTTLWSAPGVTGVTFNPARYAEVLSRYMYCRPIGAKLTLTLRYNLFAGTTNGPIQFIAFPYQTEDPALSNYWSETTTPLPLTQRIVSQLPYSVKCTLDNWNVKSRARMSIYVDFAKLYGYTRTQWLSDGNAVYIPGGTNTPVKMVKVALAAYDLMTGGSVAYVCSVSLKQYCRFEGTQLKP